MARRTFASRTLKASSILWTTIRSECCVDIFCMSWFADCQLGQLKVLLHNLLQAEGVGRGGGGGEGKEC